MNRRTLLKTSVISLAAAGLPMTSALAESYDQTELMKSPTLDDMALGSKDAPVTIIEYASLTCGHCANFHARTYPALKSDFIETGKVRFILREFPLDPVATGAAMLARNVSADKFFDVVDLMLERQRDWAFTGNPYESLLALAKQLGFDKQGFEKALTDQELLDAIEFRKNRAIVSFDVQATPTFFINGERYSGSMTIDEMADAIRSAA